MIFKTPINYLFKSTVVFFLLASLTGCLDTDGEIQGTSSADSSSVEVAPEDIVAGILNPNVIIGDVAQLPSPINGSSCNASEILEWNGSVWICVPTPSVAGGAATTVPASGIQSGTIGAGVLLPAGQIAAGAINPTATLTSSQLRSGCSVGQILQSDASGNFLCATAASGADNLGNHTATQAVNLNGNYLSGDGDAEGIFVDGAGNVGIGTESPTTKLDVVGSGLPVIRAARTDDNNNFVSSLRINRSRSSATAPGAGFGGAILFTLEGATNGSSPTAGTMGIGWENTQTNDTTDRDSFIRFQTIENNAVTEKMRITSAGNVGIGTTSPTTKLQVNGGIRTHDGVNPNVTISSINSSSQHDITLWSEGGIQALDSLVLSADSNGSGGGAFRFTTGSFNPTTATDLMRIDVVTGNVGIGTTSPAVELDVDDGVINASAICDESNANCIDLSVGATAASVRTVASLPAVDVAGSIIYNSATSTTYISDGTNWVPAASSGSSNSIATDADPTGNLGLGVPTGSIAYDSTDSELQVFNGTSWVPVDGSTGDNLGNHTATQAVNLNGNYLSGDGDPEGIFVDGSGNVGIGTTVPSFGLTNTNSALSVDENGLGVATTGFVWTTNFNAGGYTAAISNERALGVNRNGLLVKTINASSTKALTVNSAGVDNFVVTGVGRVGIGTGSPLTILNTKTDGAADRTSFTNADQVDLLIGRSLVSSAVDSYGASIGFSELGNSSQLAAAIAVTKTDVSGDKAGLSLFVKDVSNGASQDVTEAMRIDHSGHVGIGTTSPSQLMVVGDDMGAITGHNALVVADTTGDPRIFLGSDVANRSSMYWDNTNDFLSFSTVSAGVNYFQTMTLREGNVGIGTTSPTALLSVDGDANKSLGGGSWGVFSDERLKDKSSFKDFKYGLKDVLKLNPIYYKYSDDNELGLQSEEENVGFIAQQVQRVIPEAVSENESGYLEINNDPIIWTVLNAVKELALKVTSDFTKVFAQITGLATELDSVKKENKLMQSKLESVEKHNAQMQKELFEIKSLLLKNSSSRAPASLEE